VRVRREVSAGVLADLSFWRRVEKRGALFMRDQHQTEHQHNADFHDFLSLLDPTTGGLDRHVGRIARATFAPRSLAQESGS